MLAAPLHLTRVRRLAIDVCREHELPPEYEAWLWEGFDRGGYQVRHFATRR